MTEVVKIGPFLIQYKLMIIVLGGIAGFLFLNFFLKYKKDIFRSQLLDIFTGIATLLLFTWKFGSVLLDPKMLFTNPTLVLLSNGTQTTLFMGIAASIFYLLFKAKQQDILIERILNRMLFGVLPLLLIYQSFIPRYGYPTNLPWGISISSNSIKYHPINLYFALVIGVLLIVMLIMETKKIDGNLYKLSAFVLGITSLLFSFLFNQDIYALNLSLLQWVSIIGILAGLANHKGKKESLRKQ